MTTLDDLLGYDEPEPEPELPDRSGADATWWWLLKTALLAAVVAAPVWGILRMVGLDVPYPLLLMIGLVGRTLRSLLRWIAPRALPPTLTRPSVELISEDQAAGTAQDGLYLATARWDTRLSWTKVHGERPSSRVRYSRRSWRSSTSACGCGTGSAGPVIRPGPARCWASSCGAS